MVVARTSKKVYQPISSKFVTGLTGLNIGLYISRNGNKQFTSNVIIAADIPHLTKKAPGIIALFGEP